MNSVVTCAIIRKMAKITNLANKIEKQLPAELVNFMQVAGRVATSQGQNLYLVGGVVRDLLLGRTNFDLDLVVEGNAIELAQQLAEINQGKIVTYPQFNTAKLQWSQWSVDLATARSETYTKPGALPRVKSSSIESDLSRRDFTINTMAIYLSPSRYGELIDMYGGRNDLKHKLVRILHEKSFIDDATRIWRSLRYEQRLNFQLGKNTLKLLKRDIPMLDTISGDRIRYELECILQEERPEKVLRRAEELNVLQRLHPALKGNGWLAEKFEQARQLSSPNPPPVGLYLALLAYPLTDEENERLISRLRLPKSLAQALRDSISLKTKLQPLANPKLTPSSIYHLLHGYSSPAIITNSLASDSPVARQHIHLFLNKLRYVKPALTGNDLKRMSITPGPQIKEILQRLHEARLDGKVTSKQGEKELVKEWLG
ncbi:MAG: CCA tRNA nucleotidyltransferase [Dehalococcoidia bacterium]|nr:MAG: CCA tRNA nucleotidyltransferase [Dehalococcoidia bacterium]